MQLSHTVLPASAYPASGAQHICVAMMQELSPGDFSLLPPEAPSSFSELCEDCCAVQCIPVGNRAAYLSRDSSVEVLGKPMRNGRPFRAPQRYGAQPQH